jgi:hypothetical protein
MARDYLAVPGTSTPSERAFSGGRQLITDFRCSLLKGGTITACMLLKNWRRQWDELYNSTTTGFYSSIKSQNKYSNFSNSSNEHKSVFEFEVRSSSFEFSNELFEFVGALMALKSSTANQ